jgi:hypothetical protein
MLSFVDQGAREMKSSHWRSSVLLAVLAAALFAVACTGSEVLPARTQNLNVELEVVDADIRFQVGVLQVNQIAIRPVDPDADNSLGSNDLGLLQTPVEVAYNVVIDDIITTPLTDGTYQVLSLAVNPVLFIDNDGPASEDSCEDYVAVWAWFSDMSFTDFGQEVYVTVENGRINNLKVIVKGQDFLTAFQEAWSCRTFSCPGGAPYCLSGFNQAAFTSRSAEFLEFE